MAGTRETSTLQLREEQGVNEDRGLILAARLKAQGVDYLVIDKNAEVGDNWRLRYDCLRFHIPLSLCQMPYLRKYSHT